MNLFPLPNRRFVDSSKGTLYTRKKLDQISKFFFGISNGIAILALTILLLTIINQSFTMVATVDMVDRSTLISQPVESLPKTELIKLLENNLTPNRIKTLDREKPLSERNETDLRNLVESEVFKTSIVDSVNLFNTLIHPKTVKNRLLEEYPNARVSFHSWINWSFITNTMSKKPEESGIRTALLGSLFIILIAILFSFPLGVSTAIFLEEYSSKSSRLARLVQTNIDNLAGVPSILYGVLGLAIFVRALGPITSGNLFGSEAANGRTILSAGLTMALLILPILITNSQEAIRAVPNSLRLASYGLGATKWQTVWHHVLPSALPGILTGSILAISRGLGETAPLIIVGAATFITKNPTSLFSNFTALPIQIYNWTTRPQPEYRNAAAAAILVLLILLLSLNSVAILWRNRIQKRTRI
jgi:phosphate transport system permease protein